MAAPLAWCIYRYCDECAASVSWLAITHASADVVLCPLTETWPRWQKNIRAWDLGITDTLSQISSCCFLCLPEFEIENLTADCQGGNPTRVAVGCLLPNIPSILQVRPSLCNHAAGLCTTGT